MTPIRTSPHAGRGLPVALLLFLAVGLTALLALLAWQTARYHRVQAESMLRDYARFAAESYAVRAAQSIYAAFAPALDAVERPATETPPLLQRATSVFALGSDGVLHATGGGRLLEVWLTDTLRRDLLRYAPSWYFTVITTRIESVPHLVVYRVRKGEHGAQRAHGLVVPANALEPAWSAASRNGTLLPPALAGRVPAESLGAIRVLAAADAELFRTRAIPPSPFVARAAMGDYFGDLTVEATLDPAAAERLVIGGFPRYRLPIILALLLLSAALVVMALVQLRKERELARLRTDFVSSVSHELRTPLAQVRMFAETLRLGRVRSDAERQRALAILEQEARRLTHLVENLLYFARSERSALQLLPQPASLHALAHDVVDGFRPLAASRHATLRLEGEDTVTARVDEAAFRQVLLNLLDNAVKYGPVGQIVRIGVQANEGAARVWVEDEGPGIPREDRERVWHRFWRLERDRGSATAGTGIGLSVVRDLMHSHGGRAVIEDSRQGTRVVLEFPRDGAES